MSAPNTVCLAGGPLTYVILRSAVTFPERHCTTARQVVILRSASDEGSGSCAVILRSASDEGSGSCAVILRSEATKDLVPALSF